jgi:hypothetical protein
MKWKLPDPVKVEAGMLLGIAYTGVTAAALSAFLPGPPYTPFSGQIVDTPTYWGADEATSGGFVNDDYANMNNLVVAAASRTAASHQALPNGVRIVWTSGFDD